SLLQRWTRCPCSASEALRKRWSVKWYEQVYRGRGDRMPQLTWRAVLMGTALGGALSLTNLYIGLKAGWGFGVAITACILSYAIWTTLHRARIVPTPMTILENNCMQSTASSAGYSTGGTLISAFAAYMLITHDTLSLPVMLSWEPMFVAAGAITGLHVCWSMLLGSVTAWMVFAPILQHRGVIEGSGYGTIVQWTLWGGVACMVSSSLLSFAMQWRTALRAFADFRTVLRLERNGATAPLAAIEAPISWFIWGQLVGFAALAWLGHVTFGMPYWQTAAAVVLSFGLALVVCRVTGETDTTPVGAM